MNAQMVLSGTSTHQMHLETFDQEKKSAEALRAKCEASFSDFRRMGVGSTMLELRSNLTGIQKSMKEVEELHGTFAENLRNANVFSQGTLVSADTVRLLRDYDDPEEIYQKFHETAVKTVQLQRRCMIHPVDKFQVDLHPGYTIEERKLTLNDNLTMVCGGSQMILSPSKSGQFLRLYTPSVPDGAQAGKQLGLCLRLSVEVAKLWGTTRFVFSCGGYMSEKYAGLLKKQGFTKEPPAVFGGLEKWEHDLKEIGDMQILKAESRIFEAFKGFLLFSAQQS